MANGWTLTFICPLQPSSAVASGLGSDGLGFDNRPLNALGVKENCVLQRINEFAIQLCPSVAASYFERSRIIGKPDVVKVSSPTNRLLSLGWLSVCLTLLVGCQNVPTAPDASYQSSRWLHQGDKELEIASRHAATPWTTDGRPNETIKLVSNDGPTVRAQDTPSGAWGGGYGPTGAPRGPMPAAGGPAVPNTGQPASNGNPRVAQNPVEPGYPALQPPGEWSGAPQDAIPYSPFYGPSYEADPNNPLNLPPNFADIDAVVQEGQTGRFMIGAGINSDAGLTGQLIFDEKKLRHRGSAKILARCHGRLCLSRWCPEPADRGLSG